MKNILVATDFSNNAYCALFYATKLLGSETCTFYIMNTYSELTMLPGKTLPILNIKKHLKQLELDSKEKLTHTKHKIVLDNENPLHTFKTISQKGDLVDIIIEKIEELKIHLVTMGNKGLTETADIFFGSNTIKVANHIKKCPLLAIPGQMDFHPIKEIAFVTDLKKDCDQKTIAQLLYIASLSKASIRVVHVHEQHILNTTQEANRKNLEDNLSSVGHSFQWIKNFDDKAKVIDIFLEKLKVDMFAMVHQKRNLFEKLTREPVVKDLSMYSDIPFLILPSQE
ncbi:universal stress protein [Arenibacter sp. F20364]|uniref:universal stress protein n=1 Tax=Arenibacter sp. F20364 TaxID=2926415 RepID=UPI001FF38246|nr:universal stress protein [Arenibacter sp. F20364]MCK0190324.1 universal stress protein [Arenibacter sp. F20364]